MAAVYGTYRVIGWGHSWTMENRNNPDSYSASKRAQKLSLEEEIRLLREKMERKVEQGNALTSDLVVQISRLLDEKLNEYMNKSKKR